MRQDTANTFRSTLQRCSEDAASGVSTQDCDDLAGSQYPWAYSGPTRFSGPDLTRGQDVRALTIGVLAQSYLVSLPLSSCYCLQCSTTSSSSSCLECISSSPERF
ncbi:hypothetical protein BDV98DRAFT_337175 [Pterulicium gracile]|uniref:Uncharacterized protein n=1 Tax=Pterulicium gracile TaxID=1884261 RepID=A0A5C3Q2B6_9AGAR|nr:hypothetical protein BDV98DRAFT_337175 [Pterula gracilis]